MLRRGYLQSWVPSYLQKFAIVTCLVALLFGAAVGSAQAGAPATYHLRPATCDLPPATCHLRPTIWDPPPAHMPPTTYHMRTCDLPPATCHLRPALPRLRMG